MQAALKHARWVLYFGAFVLALLATPPSEAQQAGKVYRIGMLWPRAPSQPDPLGDAFRQGMRDHGWVEGQNWVSETRWADGKPERLPALATELVRLRVDLIVTTI